MPIFPYCPLWDRCVLLVVRGFAYLANACVYAYAFWCYRREVYISGLVLSKHEQAEAIRLMEDGLKADKDDPIVVWQAGCMKISFQRDFEAALALIDRSLSIDPNSTRALIANSMPHSFMGDTV